MNRVVADVMAAPVVSVQPDASFKRMVHLLASHGIGALPVVDPGGRLLGIVSETDLVLKEERQPGDAPSVLMGEARRRRYAKAHGTTAADFMSAPVVAVPQGASLSAAAGLLHEHDIRHLPVLDDTGRLVGIVARRDLLSVFLHPDGAIRGEIAAAVLRGTFNLPAGAVQVDVCEGVVTLSGRVPWRSTAREVVDRVRALDDVVEVVDRLSWGHDDTVSAAATPWA